MKNMNSPTQEGSRKKKFIPKYLIVTAQYLRKTES